MSNREENQKKKTIVIGGGAAGFFAAINLALLDERHEVTILEKTGKLLSKVRISGGGRCNVTHSCFNHAELVKNYPRGHRELRQVFSRFDVQNTIDWFKERGVSLKTEEDGRMFPFSDSSETIIDCFLNQCKLLGIRILTNTEVFSVKKENEKFIVNTSGSEMYADHLIVAAGGHHKEGAYNWIRQTGHTIEPPLPSLFTLNMPGEIIRKELQGVSVPCASVKVKGSKQEYNGPLLITHWGISGPAVLKLSAYAARELSALNYTAEVHINWDARYSKNEMLGLLKSLQKEKPRTLPATVAPVPLPKRLWEHLLKTAAMPEGRPWAEIGNKHTERLADVICGHVLKAEGKTTFKEEFVTCGGVTLKEIDFRTMESKIVRGLYFCGEVLDIDGITGGFNFQAAWSTAWLCAHAISVAEQ